MLSRKDIYFTWYSNIELTCNIHKLIYYESISAATKENARLLVLKIAKAIPASQNPVLSFIVDALNSHDNKLMNNTG